MAKAKKQRAEKYDPKLKIEGTFEDVIGVSVDVKAINKQTTKKNNMEWKSFPKESPTETGNYIASIRRQLATGQYVFSDLAHYNSESQRWFKYDPFDEKYTPTEDITNNVVGWASDMGSYLG